MARYYVNKNAQSTGEHEVHRESCQKLPYPENRIFLGNFNSCQPAVTEARRYYKNVDGCFHCSRPCHTR
ncbi:MAG: hypothetical protein EP340_10385 [Alphaproteobacteria bacterium]|nr:MAG: hypothetical protein EP340_10385 [Alphaproteobacteria bacterium]